MSFEEKVTWSSGITAIVGVAAYITALLARADGADLSQVPFVDLLLIFAIGVPIGAAIVSAILIAAIWHPKGQAKDQRDKAIDRHGEYVAGSLLAVLMIVPFALALADVDTFWIANAMYLAFVTSAVVGAIVKIVVYRRGF